ncbi:P-loop containing nucleoside triphosphate hydrolase [Bacillus freudenreichii]|nr:P-loop containing nucleoside triphosphate hydrolase [Bacillus freudenreichii]
MKKEDCLVKKAYYEEKFLQEDSGEHPIRQLGELYLTEQKKDMSDLSYIRFAQGEVYFHNCDYEAAIFKWENIHNEMEPWAKKNIADAYFELGFLSTAEDIYKSITTESLTLNTEVALQLFTLYLEQSKYGEADQMIKNAVVLNPDYQNVTELACAFFEERKDWNSAVELAVNEAARTKSVDWFQKLHSFIENGHTHNHGASHFVPILYLAQKVDLALFEKLMSALWKNHETRDDYMAWITEATIILLDSDLQHTHQWKSLPQLMNETFIQLLSGKYYLAEMAEIMPNLLTAWSKIADVKTAPLASAAALAWNDVFPSQINKDVIHSVEEQLSQSTNQENLLVKSMELADSIKSWADGRGLKLHSRFASSIRELADLNTNRIMLAGKSTSEKSSFVNLLLNQPDSDMINTALPVLYKDGDEVEFQLISDENITTVSSSKEIIDAEGRQDTMLKYSAPNSFLREQSAAIIDYPEMDTLRSDSSQFLEAARMCDGLLFVLNTIEPFSAEECEFLLDVSEKIPFCPIHFVVKKSDMLTPEKITDIGKRIKNYFPEAELVTYSVDGNDVQQQEAFTRFIGENLSLDHKLRLRTGSMLFFIRRLIKHLLQQQVKVEEDLHESIQFEEDLLSRLQGAIHQLYDVEEEKTKAIQNAYRSLKDEIHADLLTTIPKLIKESADILREDSDYGNVHHLLNDEMNKRIDEYLQYTVHPTYINSLQDWISFSEGELNEAQELLISWNDSFNHLMGEERLRLECDFQILADWQRDADRMTGAIQIDKENILLKRTPSQVLLKSAGKIFGVIPANNTMMYNRYKNFIENENYHETAESIANKFFRQFELLEKAIPRDISLFFREPFKVLKKSADSYQEQVETNKAALSEMRSHPETFRDPIKLFDVRLRQIEWLEFQGKDSKIVY